MAFGVLSIQPKIPEISVWNQMERTISVRFDRSIMGPPLKVVHFDLSSHFGWLDRNVPFHLTKLLSPVPLFCILLTRRITKNAGWFGSGLCNRNVPFRWAREISEISNRNFCWMEVAPWIPSFLLGLETVFWPIGSKAFVIFFLRLVC